MSLETRSISSYSYRREPSIIRSLSVRTWDDAQSILQEEAPELVNPCIAIPDKCKFIYPDIDSYRKQTQQCPRVTLNIFQQGWEPQEFDTELGEPQKKTLPAYYYEASRTIRGKGGRGSSTQRKSQSAKQSETPVVTSRRAFASPVNNEPIYYPECEINKRYPVITAPPSDYVHRGLSVSEVHISISGK